MHGMQLPIHGLASNRRWSKSMDEKLYLLMNLQICHSTIFVWMFAAISDFEQMS